MERYQTKEKPMKYLIVGIVFLSTLCLAEEKSFNISKGILDIKNSSGAVNIIGVEGGVVKVSYTKVKWEKGCNLVLKKKNDKVVIEVEHDSGLFSSSLECDVNFKILMSKKVELSAKLGSGDISIEGLESNCEFKTGSGNIAITKSVVNNLNGKLGSGDISAKGQFGEIDFKTGSGKISVIFDKISGKTTLNAKSGSGQIKNIVGYSDDALVVIDAMTGSGDLTIENN